MQNIRWLFSFTRPKPFFIFIWKDSNKLLFCYPFFFILGCRSWRRIDGNPRNHKQPPRPPDMQGKNMSMPYILFLCTFSTHCFIHLQLVEKLRCILFLPNLFPSLTRRFPFQFAPFELTALTALSSMLLKNRRLVRKKNILFPSTNSTF